MTFAARTLGYLSTYGLSASVTVGNMFTTLPRIYTTWWGWSTVYSAGIIYYPDSPTRGSVSPTPLSISGVQILGIASVSTPGNTTNASTYYVYAAGTNTTLLTTLTVAGVLMTTPSVTYDATSASVPVTRYGFAHSDTVSLFGNTVGASIPIIII